MPGQGKLKEFSFVKREDTSIFARLRTVGRTTAAGAELTTATVQSVSASNYVEFLLNTVGDAGINDYTGAGGAAGRILYSDANANSVGEFVNITNGIGAGQPGTNRRWRAAVADFPRLYAFTTGDILNDASPRSTLVGHRSLGVSLFADTSALAAVEYYCGIGSEGGVVAGAGLVSPDYFEDRPGESGITGFASNAPDRTRQVAKQNDEAGVTVVYTPVITRVSWNAVVGDNNKRIQVFREDDDPATATPLYEELLSAANNSVALDGSGDFKVTGFPGEMLHVRVFGTGALTDGALVVSGYYELSLRR